ncbi:putative oligoribonuclease [Tetrabaena socialis]|uniref:Putative oligoribonuclease n=1 Tax=Tetrabaena socialis TaxID=47790 RepID=A0A2J7ZKF7_9CHLO|nr:putative oligoribonuclease [Tetrabaena socialis]|eukprot:PNH00755.1 putative oligoribonuclease [Tetrabaena socialis]
MALFLDRLLQGPCLAIHHDEEVLANMNAWCIEHHGKSGLTQRVRESTTSLAEAEDQLLAFLVEHTAENAAQLAGNSIHVDRMFLYRYMPRVVAHLSYRIVDVSSIKEVARRWFPQTYRKAPRKELKHTAESDIRESISELKFYRKAVFKDPKQCK